MTMIDPATSLFEIYRFQNIEAQTVSSVVEKAWLTQYLWPSIVFFDKGTEMMGNFAQTVDKEYGIQQKIISIRNPQAKVIIGKIETFGYIICNFEIQSCDDLEEKIHGQEIL
jgi:hypothetical protein